MMCITSKRGEQQQMQNDIYCQTHTQTHRTYPEVVEGEVGQAHASDVFGQLFQHLRVLCLK